jgi:aminotransferase EvaB
VITVANAGVPTIAAIRAAGAIPRFVDIDPKTHLLDPAGLEDARTSNTRCVIPIHLYGQAVDLEAVCAFAARHDLRVIEDCAQAHGALYRGRHVGTFGDVGCFSFYPTKNLGALGDGGLAITRNTEVAERLRALRMYGFDADRHARREGLNSRLDELQAAVLRVKLAHLDVELEARRALAAQYQEALAGTLYRCLETAPGNTHAFHLFVVEAPDRLRAIEALRRVGIGSGIHYAVPVHRMDAYAFLGWAAGSLPVTEAAAQVVLSLPLYPGLLDTAVSKVAAALPS